MGFACLRGRAEVGIMGVEADFDIVYEHYFGIRIASEELCVRHYAVRYVCKPQASVAGPSSCAVRSLHLKEEAVFMLGLGDPLVIERIEGIDIPFNVDGYDRYGVSRDHLIAFVTALRPVYEHYLRMTVFGRDQVPDEGGALLIGNHSGGIAFDAAMVLCALVLEGDSPRLAHGMVEQFLARWPFANTVLSRIGQFSGLPEHAERLLNDRRLLLVFPEGARGTGKLYRDRYQLVRFGTGFMRLALKTGKPIVPFAFIGAEEAFPSMFHVGWLAKLLRAPYVPVPPQLLPIPLPFSCQLYFGEPMHFEGTGDEPDDVVLEMVARVRNVIQHMVDQGIAARPTDFMLRRMPDDDEPLTKRGGR